MLTKYSFKIIMTLMDHFDLELHQTDVKITFLSGNLSKEVYMRQPEGFEVEKNKGIWYVD